MTTENPSLEFPPMKTTSLVPAGTSLAQTGALPSSSTTSPTRTSGRSVRRCTATAASSRASSRSDSGPSSSTGATGIAAGIAGLVDGGLGPNSNKIGPIPINTAAAVVFAAGAVFGPNSDIR